MRGRERGATPRFITFEGGEGAGKSSLMNRLAQRLRRKGIPLIKTREPGGTVFGEQMRQWILNHDPSLHFDAKAELMLFLAVRAQHIEEKIAPALKNEVLVLCDRFNDSTVAYQGVGRNLGMQWVRDLCALVCQGVTPDLTFYLDVDPMVGLMRTRRIEKKNAPSGKLDRIESEALNFHLQIREAFHLIAKSEPERVYIIDASRSQENVFAKALALISERYSDV